jgi:hypothetical protein
MQNVHYFVMLFGSSRWSSEVDRFRDMLQLRWIGADCSPWTPRLIPGEVLVGFMMNKLALMHGFVHELHWRIPSSGMWRRMALVQTDISEVCIASIIRVKRINELGTTLALTINWFSSPWLWRQYIPPKCMLLQDPHGILHSHCRETLKSYKYVIISMAVAISVMLCTLVCHWNVV